MLKLFNLCEQGADVEMVDAVSPKTNQNDSKSGKKTVIDNCALFALGLCYQFPYILWWPSDCLQPQTPATPVGQATTSKTLFVGNLSFNVEQADVYVPFTWKCDWLLGLLHLTNIVMQRKLLQRCWRSCWYSLCFWCWWEVQGIWACWICLCRSSTEGKLWVLFPFLFLLRSSWSYCLVNIKVGM